MHGETKFVRAPTALLYGSENWTRDARDVRRIIAAETKYTSNKA